MMLRRAVATSAAALVLCLLPRAGALRERRPLQKWSRLQLGADIASSRGGARNRTNTTIVLNGEPKSGTTWLEYVAREIMVRGCTEGSGCTLVKHERTVSGETADSLLSYSIDEKHTIPNIGHINKFDFTPAPSLTVEEISERARLTLQEAGPNKKWLVIFRDPRDVTISSCYHMYKNCPEADKYVRGKIRTVAAWINLRYQFFKALQDMAPDRVMLVFYEDLKNDEVSSIKDVAHFFGFDLKAKESRLIQEVTTFSSMKEIPVKSMPQGGAASGKVREGATCSYTSELSAEVAEKVTKAMRHVLCEKLNGKWSC